MVSINTNLLRLKQQQVLFGINTNLNQTIKRLSSGLRINSAADDAASLSISKKLENKSRGIDVANNNIQTGINMIDTADDSLKLITSHLDRMRVLSLEAANGVYSDLERQNIQAEIDELSEEILRLQNTTTFGDIPLFVTSEKVDKNQTYILNPTTQPITRSLVPKARSAPVAESPPQGGREEAPTLLSSEANSIQLQSPQVINNDGLGISAFSIEDENQGISLMSLSAPIEFGKTGSLDFEANESIDVMIDGSLYTLTNLNASSASISFSKDSNDVTTFMMNKFKIELKDGYTHKINIQGAENRIFGSNGNDEISILASNSNYNNIYAGGGNDTIINKGLNTVIELQSGNNNLHSTGSNATIYGGTGDDTYTVTNSPFIIKDMSGNNTFNVTGNNQKIVTGDGNDTFNISAGVTGTIIDGGGGTNTLNNSGTNTLAANVGAQSNAEAATFTANQEKIITIDGKKYSIKNNKNEDNIIMYNVSSGTTNFLVGENFTIKALDNVSYNVNLALNNSYFYGSNQNDKIVCSSSHTNPTNRIYGMDGDDEIYINQKSVAYGGKGNDKITAHNVEATAYGEEGDDTITLTGDGSAGYGGEGNDTINLNGSNIVAGGDDGNDTFVNKSGTINNTIIGGEGTNTLSGSTNNLALVQGVEGYNANYVRVEKNSTQTININGVEYTLKTYETLGVARDTDYINLGYQYNPVDGSIIFAGNRVEIQAQEDVSHDVTIYGSRLVFRGGDKDDTITHNATYTTLYGGGGDDYITMNVGENSVYGETGNDTIVTNKRISTIDSGDGDDTIILNPGGGAGRITGGEGNNTWEINTNNVNINANDGNNSFTINGNNNTIMAGTGQDTFIVNGDGNNMTGGGGNDYFMIESGSTNNTVGGTGNNYIVDNGTGTTKTDVVNDPNSGILSFSSVNEQQEITLFGKTYTIKNTTTETSATATNSLMYNYNPNTNEIVFSGSKFTISSSDNIDHNIVVKGSYNVINGGNQNDNIQIWSGSNNKINGNNGNDTIISNSTNNKLLGGDGNDNITVNRSNSNYEINGGNGDDIITVKASNCTNVKGGNDNDQITMTGDNNQADGGQGQDTVGMIGNNNTISVSDSNNNLYAKGNNNQIIESGHNSNQIGFDGENNTANLGNGNNNINIVTGASVTNGNTITTGSGDNNITITGQNTSISTGNGNNNININGLNNTIQTGSGVDNINLNGANNTIKAGAGDDIISVSGHDNTIEGQDGNDSFTNKLGSSNNSFDGGNGNDTFFERGSNSILSSIEIIDLGNKGEVTINSGSSVSYIIGGKEVTFSNSTAQNELLKFEKLNDTLSFTTNNLQIQNKSDEKINIEIIGNNNQITGSNLNDDITINGNNNQILAQDGDDSIFVSGNSNTINAGDGNDSINIIQGSDNTVNGGTGADSATNSGQNTTISNMDFINKAVEPIILQVGANADDYFSVNTGFVVPAFQIKVTNPNDALSSISNIDKMIEKVVEKRSELGALKNNLESMYNSNSSRKLNLVNSLSTITDADFAIESANLTKNQILQNSSINLMNSSKNIDYNVAKMLLGF